MMVETSFKVEFEDCIGDNFDERVSEKIRQRVIEEHILDYCREKSIPRSAIKIIR